MTDRIERSEINRRKDYDKTYEVITPDEVYYINNRRRQFDRRGQVKAEQLKRFMNKNGFVTDPDGDLISLKNAKAIIDFMGKKK